MPRQLRVAPVTAPEARPGRTRRAARVAAVAALILGMAVLVIVVVRSVDEPVDPSTRGPAEVPAAPAELEPRTTVVHARVTPSGDVVMRQWIRSASTVFGIRLSSPPGTGATADSPPVRVRDVRVFANGGAAMGPERLAKEGEYYPFDAGTNDVFVRYQLVGAVERSGSLTGRALATVTALDVDVIPPLVATTYAVSGGNVLALACAPDGPDAVPVPCGAPAGRGWRVERAGKKRDDVVMAQLDLP